MTATAFGPMAASLPGWLWADPDHVFWMRVVLALAGGFWVAVAGAAGFILFRRRERARLEEELHAALRKQMIDALMTATQTWLAHYTAHNEAATCRALLEKASDTAEAEQIRAFLRTVDTREQEEFAKLKELMTTKGLLFPEFIVDAYVRYATAVPGTKQRRRGFRQMELAFKSLLPKMNVHLGPFWKLRFRLGSWSGWESEKEDDA